MSKFKLVLTATIAAMGLVAAAGASASTYLKHHKSSMLGATANDMCTPGTVCITFNTDGTMGKTVDVQEVTEAVVSGQYYQDSDDELLGGGYWWYEELAPADVAQFKISKVHEYLATVDGHTVGRLCDITLSGNQLRRPQNIELTVGTDGHGHYTCRRH